MNRLNLEIAIEAQKVLIKDSCSGLKVLKKLEQLKADTDDHIFVEIEEEFGFNYPDDDFLEMNYPPPN